jgi:hypothetical protein
MMLVAKRCDSKNSSTCIVVHHAVQDFVKNMRLQQRTNLANLYASTTRDDSPTGRRNRVLGVQLQDKD